MENNRRSKAAVLTGSGKPIELWARGVPPPAHGCINIRVLRAGVCGTDPHLWKGDQDIPEAVVLGHEGLGQIIEIGEGVEMDHGSQSITIGDVVYWNPIRPCNRCYDCTISEDFTSCMNGTFWSPANQGQVWASYTEIATLLPNNSFYKVDKNVPLDAFIALGCALPTMLNAVNNLGGIPFGCTVVVQGAGPVGLAAVMLSKLAGAEHIVCVEGNETRLWQAEKFGATFSVNMRKPDLATAEARRCYINNAVGNRGVNLVIECSGNASAFEEGIGLLARNGKYLLVGTWAGNSTVPVNPFYIVQKALTIVGSTFASPKDYYRAIKIVEANHQRLPLADCVTHKYGLEDTEKALLAVAAGDVIKAVILPQGLER